MADRLIIRDLLAQCRIGVTDAERDVPQSIWLDLSLEIDAAQAAAHDDVQGTIDYAHLVGAVRRYVEGKSFRLLETMAEEVASLILDGLHPPQVTITVKKRALPGIECAAVEITRP